MAVFLNTRGNSNLAIAICDRCRFKYPIGRLSPDRNTPGLMVCDTGCNDEFDPWRLPPREPDNITLPFYRPDALLQGSNVVDDSTYLVTTPAEDFLTTTPDDDYFIVNP